MTEPNPYDHPDVVVAQARMTEDMTKLIEGWLAEPPANGTRVLVGEYTYENLYATFHLDGDQPFCTFDIVLTPPLNYIEINFSQYEGDDGVPPAGD